MSILILTYLSIGVAYVLFFSVISIFKSKKRESISSRNHSFLFMIPAYKEDSVILETVKSLENQPDLGEYDKIMVIADHMKPSTLKALRNSKADIIEISLEKSTKAKSINIALDQISSDFDAVVLLDADNHLVPGFITKTKAAFSDGHNVIQTHRIAKNLDTNFAFLDAISEEINNSVFRKGHANIGLSAALIGSGLVMEFKEFRAFMRKIDVVSGFDKQLELDLLRKGQKISYLEDAYVLDEKVRESKVFENQRTRWISAQFNFAKKNFFNAFRALFQGNIDYFDKVLQFLLPPRLILLGAVFLSLIIHFFIDMFIVWNVGLAIGYVAGLWLAIPSYLRKIIRLKDFASVPISLWFMVKAILKFKRANNVFIHTPHVNTISK
ncbi:MAG TPA: glycosyltransferase family 2 protein [Leadbetterella sp.]|nr:glycosyltransferase family 2 protein [Leadbetterella sp.]